MRTKNIRYLQSQFVVAFKQILERPDHLWNTLQKDLTPIFDQMPVVIPVPNEPQLREVPVVHVTSRKNVTLTISRSRLDFYVRLQKKDDRYEVRKNELSQYAQYFISTLSSNIQWIGFISQFFIETQNPGVAIAKLLQGEFKHMHDGDVLESSVDFITTVQVNNKKVNNHTQLIQGKTTYQGDKEEHTGVILIRDYNTKQQDNSDTYITTDFVQSFLQYGEDHFLLEDIIKQL